jgi:hypothetical protein
MFLFPRAIVSLLLLAAWHAAVAAPACSASSPAHSAALVQLFTSEGCDSCPPADRWLARLRSKGYTEERLVPLAFHVDYWDYLGWRDRFASPEFSQRHRDQASLNQARVVYTPQVFVDSREFRDWRNEDRVRAEIARINARESGIRLDVSASRLADGRLDVKLAAEGRPNARELPAQVYVAVYENGLESQVTAGENKNVLLRHERVVRELLGPFALTAEGRLATAQTITLPAGLRLERAGLTAFTEPERPNVPRQAVSLAFAGCLGPDK